MEKYITFNVFKIIIILKAEKPHLDQKTTCGVLVSRPNTWVGLVQKGHSALNCFQIKYENHQK